MWELLQVHGGLHEHTVQLLRLERPGQSLPESLNKEQAKVHLPISVMFGKKDNHLSALTFKL